MVPLLVLMLLVLMLVHSPYLMVLMTHLLYLMRRPLRVLLRRLTKERQWAQ
jgi:hypothetical protein